MVSETFKVHNAPELKIRFTVAVSSTLNFLILLDLKDRKSTRLNSCHIQKSRMPSSACKKKDKSSGRTKASINPVCTEHYLHRSCSIECGSSDRLCHFFF